MRRPYCGRQRAGNQGQAADDAGVDDLAEAADAIGQHDAVDAVLEIGVLVADMQLAAGGGVLRDAWSSATAPCRAWRWCPAAMPRSPVGSTDRSWRRSARRCCGGPRRISHSCPPALAPRSAAARPAFRGVAPVTTRVWDGAAVAHAAARRPRSPGSAVMPFPAGAAVCDSAGLPNRSNRSEAAPEAANIDFVNTDIVPIPIRPRPDSSSSTNLEAPAVDIRRTDFD